jgi:hypothetical protein
MTIERAWVRSCAKSGDGGIRAAAINARICHRRMRFPSSFLRCSRLWDDFYPIGQGSANAD